MCAKVIMNDEVFIAKGYIISTDKALLQFDVIFNFLDQESYWANGIAPEKLQRSIDNSICFGVYKSDVQVGFARVITDKATFAYLADVFIVKTERGKGLSKWLVQTILAHPDLQGLRRWNLATLDAHTLYASFGFNPLSNTNRWMEIFTPYTKPEAQTNQHEH